MPDARYEPLLILMFSFLSQVKSCTSCSTVLAQILNHTKYWPAPTNSADLKITTLKSNIENQYRSVMFTSVECSVNHCPRELQMLRCK